jgi:hypothetical protein
MILTECRQGERVVYIPGHLTKCQANVKPGNTGVIWQVNDRYVFVLYNGSQTAQATPPALLHRLDDFYKKKQC